MAENFMRVSKTNHPWTTNSPWDFVGEQGSRKEVLDTIKTYLNNRPKPWVLQISGVYKIGKSSVINKALSDIEIPHLDLRLLDEETPELTEEALATEIVKKLYQRSDYHPEDQKKLIAQRLREISLDPTRLDKIPKLLNYYLPQMTILLDYSYSRTHMKVLDSYLRTESNNSFIWEMRSFKQLPYEQYKMKPFEARLEEKEFEPPQQFSRPYYKDIKIQGLLEEEVRSMHKALEIDGLDEDLDIIHERILNFAGRYPLFVQNTCAYLREVFSQKGSDKETLLNRVNNLLESFLQYEYESLSEYANQLKANVQAILGLNMLSSDTWKSASLDDIGVTYRTGNAENKLIDLLNYYFRRHFFQQKEEIHMDSTIMIAQAAAVAAWLWPFIVPGAKGFVEGVGKGMGTEFARLTWSITERARKRDPKKASQAESLDNNHLAIELVLQELQDNPADAKNLLAESRPALQKLLKNTDYFVDEDVREHLIPSLGYTPEQIAGPNATQAALVNRFVNKLWADWKQEDLVNEIRQLKPHLF